ncbi:MAG: F0F1 ATP synthase subunit A [Patescibacteria group bacterium]
MCTEEQLETCPDEANAEIIHETTIFAEPIFNIGSFHVTNSLLNSWLVVFIVVIISLIVRSKVSAVPQKLQNVFEMVIEMFLGVFDSVTGSREKSLKFFPLVFSFFIFILLNNWLGLLPGIGSIGNVIAEHGEKIFVPYFRRDGGPEYDPGACNYRSRGKPYHRRNGSRRLALSE